VSPELSLFSLFYNASLLVQLVMGLLLMASLASWTVIFHRWKALDAARLAIDDFEHTFWSGADLSKLYQRLGTQRSPLTPPEALFFAGFKEFVRLCKQGTMQADAIMEGVQRVMRVALGKEVEELESNLGVLATIGSISPYVGLFGTVWGIMNSFRALGQQQQASLSMVAPGIAEALVATAMGLFAAIPAVIAYNRYSHKAQVLTNRYGSFAEEFMSVLHRQAYTPTAVPATSSPETAMPLMA
jgi:biopolymer transport protein TolQ